MQVAPIIPGYWLILVALSATAMVAIDARRLLNIHRPRHCMTMTALRLAAILALMTFLARPQTVTRTPERSRLKTAVMVDVSRSMDTQFQDTTRLQTAEKLLRQPTVRDFLAQSQRTDLITFANTSQRTDLKHDTDVRLQTQAGNTRLGDALLKLLESHDHGTPYAAVILLSDGRNVDGASPILAAKQCKNRNLPISTICFPGGHQLPDVGVTTEAKPLHAVRNQPFTVNATINATGQDVKQLPVQLLADGQVIDQQQVDVSTRQPSHVSFTTKLPLAGFKVLTVKAVPNQPDARPDNNVDFVAVHVAEPPTFTVLYLDYGLDWEWRFLRLNARKNPQLTCRAVIQTARNRFFTEGLPPLWTRKPGFPTKAEQLEDVDVIIASLHCLNQLTEQQLKTLRNFVEFKGGGLILRGLDTPLPELIRPLLPARRLETVTVSRPRAFHVRQDLIYRRDSAKHLTPQGGAWIQPVNQVATIAEPQHGTRILATLDSQDGPAFFAVHAFGAGRVAFLGFPATWQWALHSDDMAKLHAELWNRLVVWLAQATKPMVSIAGNGSRIPAGEPADVTLDILGSDFKPDPNATLTATLTLPDGQVQTLAPLPHLEDVGRYVLTFTPEQPGEYRLNIRATHKHHTATGQAVFLAVQDSRETNHPEDDAPLLQDIARITGGKYFLPEQFAQQVANTPFSPNVPLHEAAKDMIPPWLSVAIAFAAATAAWYARRRLGLK